jgi:Ribbon-helix-helix protein, copG family
MRTTIYLTDEQVKGLAAYCGEERISRAEAVRRAIDLYIRERRREALRNSFGAWKHLGIDTDAYLAGIRSEWDRDWDRQEDFAEEDPDVRILYRL